MKALGSLKHAILIPWLLAAFFWQAAAAAAVNVPEYHNHDSRDGLYIDSSFTHDAVVTMTRDLTFNGTISGAVYAQPLYIENGPGGKSMVIVVTEADNVYALDAADGTVIWQRNVGTPVPLSSLPCGNIDPLGITGTPVVDLTSRTLFFDAMTTPDGGTTKRHLLYAMNVDTGTTNSGWPVDMNAKASFGTNVFTSTTQNQRSALAFLGGNVYVSFGGHAGDCGTYYGWIVGVPLTNPAIVTSWATAARGGGSWGVGGISSDGVNPFIATGNTFGASSWAGGESIIRFQPGPVFSTNTNDYWAPVNWMDLDAADLDLGGSGPLIVNVPGATPSAFVVSLGKDGNAYLLNRTNLGGVTIPVAQANISGTEVRQAAATYRTSLGTYVALCGASNQNQLTAFRISASNPPHITSVWTNSEGGRGSPFVTSSDGTNDFIVWGIGAEGDQRLRGFDGDTGNLVFAGGGTNELMAGTRRFITAIAARGRIFVATDNKVYAFKTAAPFTNSGVLHASVAGTNLNVSYSLTTPQGWVNLVGAATLAALHTNPQTLNSTSAPTSLQGQFVLPRYTSNSAQFYRLLLAALPTLPPAIQITNPAAGSTVSAVVSVTASATAPLGIPTVQFYLDGTALGTPMSAAPFMTFWDTELSTAGSHTLTASISDIAGGTNSATPVSVTVDNSHAARQLGIETNVSQDGMDTMQSPAFSTTSASDLVVAFVAYDGPNTGGQSASVTGAGLNWQLASRSNTRMGDSEIWFAKATTTLSSATVTAVPAFSGGYHGILTVLAFTNASGVGIVGSTSAASGAPDISLPGVFAGNWVFAVGNDWDHDTARTPSANQVLVHQRVDSAAGDTFWVQSTTVPSAANGTVDIHDTAPTGDEWNYAAVEIVATKQ